MYLPSARLRWPISAALAALLSACWLSVGLSASNGSGDDGLAAHWTFDDAASGDIGNAVTKRPAGNHGAEAVDEGLLGGAVRLSSKEDDYVDAGRALEVADWDELTIAAIVRPSSYSRLDSQNSANSRNGILGDSEARWIFSLYESGRLMFTWDASNHDYQNITSDATQKLPLNEWSHVAVVRDGAAMTLYVNGVAIKTSLGCSPANFVPLGSLHIGRVNNSTGRDFDGLIDDVRVYRRALAAKEIRGLAQQVKLAGVELPVAESRFVRLKYNNPGLKVDLGVGLWAWPLPMDYDGDGDLDLVVSCADAPYNGTYFFENPGGGKMPVFKPAVRISHGLQNAQVSYEGQRVRVTSPGFEYPNFGSGGFNEPVKLPLDANIHGNKVRANQWKFVDYDGDGLTDLVIGVGDWTEYGWDNAFNAKGQWTNGPLRGYVYLARNAGSNDKPRYEEPVKVEAAGKPMDTFGMPSPNFGDYDGDGDLDLICGDFLDTFTYFENIGSRRQPQYAAGRLLERDGKPITMDLCMITPVAIDWDADGDLDLVVGQEDGRVALMEHTGQVAGRMPVFDAPRFFQQEADELKFGALVNPVGFDWDGDGDEDLVCGNTAGYIGFIENLDGGDPPRWAAPRLLEADGQVIRIMAGPNGSIQGPAEAKWGYTTLSVADWDHDRLADLVVNSIWGKVVWYRNIGRPGSPRLAAAQPVEVEWPGPAPKPAWTWWNPGPRELAPQWRTTPVVVDWDSDGLNDLIMLDHEGYLALYRRALKGDRLVLLPPERIFRGTKGSVYVGKHALVNNRPGVLQLNNGIAGKSGRRKLTITDWDVDGKLDLLIDSVSANFLRNVSRGSGPVEFEDMGPVDPRVLAGHDTSPTTVDWDGNGMPDLVLGAEDGFFYYLKNPRASAGGAAKQQPPVVKSELIYEKAPFPQCHASTIADTPQGLVAAWFGGTREGHEDVGIWVARQDKGRWTAPTEVATGVSPDGQRYPCWNPVLYQAEGGPLLLFYKVGPNPRDWWGMLAQSTDGGQSFTAGKRLPQGIAGPIKNKPVMLDDGRLLCPSSTEDAGWRVHMEWTADLGKTWQRSGPLNDGTELALIQPSVLFHADGRLQAVCRSRQGKIAQSWSRDNGRTWSAFTLSGLPNPNSGIDAVTLQDGRHVLVYNNTPKGRTPLNVALSPDGKNWKDIVVLESEPGEYSYPAVIQTRDGKIHITYTWHRTRIKHVVLDLAAAPAFGGMR